MPLTPEEIKGRSFALGRRGYEKAEVDGFLRKVAADYEAAIEAIASASDPFGSLGREVSNVLRTAKESAEKLRRESEAEVKDLRSRAVEEAADMRRRAAEEAAGTLEQARERAVSLATEAERHAREVREESDSLARRASEEAEQVRRRAAEEANATLLAATEKAEEIIAEAQRETRAQREATERQCDEMLREAARRHQQLQAHERELHERVDAIDNALARLRSELRSGDALAGKTTDASPAVADRLRALEPDMDQVASALVEEERPEDVIRVDEPGDVRQAAPSSRNNAS